MNVTYHPNAVEQDSLEPFIKGRRRETSYKPVIEKNITNSAFPGTDPNVRY